MVKEKPLKIIVEPKYHYRSLAYNVFSGNIKLPRLGFFCDGYPSESSINFPEFIRCFNHEHLHKWLHENEGLQVCIMLDNLEIKIDENGRRRLTGLVN